MQSAIRFAAALTVLAIAGCASHEKSPRPTDTLYLAGIKPGTLEVVHLRNRRVETRHLAKLSPADPLYFIAATGGRLVTYGHDHTYSYGPAARAPARSLGQSWFFVPSATPGRVWLALLGNPRTVTLRGLREVTVGGTTTLAHTPKPPAWPIAALTTGLVIQRRTLELWNPRTGATTKLPGVFPMGARGSVVASCEDPCPMLHVTDTRARSEFDVRPPAGWRFVPTYAQDSFSPDGELLALPVHRRGGENAVALLDLTDKTLRTIPGAPLAHDYQLIAWASSGWLYFSSTARRIAAYRPGEEAARILPVRVGKVIDLAVA